MAARIRGLPGSGVRRPAQPVVGVPLRVARRPVDHGPRSGCAILGNGAAGGVSAGVVGVAKAPPSGASGDMPPVWLRPPRHARPLPRVRYNHRAPSRPMRRRLINLLTIAPLLLCVAVAALWVRSYWIADQALFCAGERLCGMHAVRGRIGLNWTSSDSYWSDANVGTGWQHTPTIRIIPPDPDLDQVYRDHFLGFAIDQFPF